MAIARIAMPFIVQEGPGHGICVQKDAVPEAATQVWLAGALVFTSGTGASVVLNKAAASQALIYGQSPDASKGSGTVANLLKPPFALFGLNHFPFDLRDRILEINVADDSLAGATIGLTTGPTWAGGGTNGQALAPGMFGRLIVPTSGTYLDYNFFNAHNAGVAPASTTQAATHIFEIIALAPGQSVNDNNPRIWVKLAENRIQG